MYCNRCGAWLGEDAAFCPSCGQPVTPLGTGESAVPSAVQAAPAAPSPTIRTAYAGFWLRLVAYVIDNLILSAVVLIVLVPIVPVFFRHVPMERAIPSPATIVFFFWFWALCLAGVWLYYSLFESSAWQATPGKRVLGLFVTDMQGQRISFARATRFFGKFLSSAILFIGYFMAGFTAKKQALHDILADCLVLRRI
jgi:uncharacterized RDD family membrane protein YckC